MFEMVYKRGAGYFWGKTKTVLVGSVCEFMDVCMPECVFVWMRSQTVSQGNSEWKTASGFRSFSISATQILFTLIEVLIYSNSVLVMFSLHILIFFLHPP